MRWRTGEYMKLAVIKRNLSKGHTDREQTAWLVDTVERLQDELHRQYNHEDRLLKELRQYRKERF